MPLTLEQRLTAFPRDHLELMRPVQLRWNALAVPYIEAQTDADAAYTLGLVHMHLRAAQLHILKRVAQGRVSEMLGPFTVGLDHALRLLDLPAVAARCEAQLATHTRVWLEPFVRGLNCAQSQLKTLPPEFRWLGMKPEPWTLRDVLTLGRLAGADVNWSSYLPLLAAREDSRFADFWRRLQIVGGSLSTPFARGIAQLARVGSNSVAIASTRSASGAPLLANDPHLGQTLPNFWMVVGVRCPSYQMVGLMPPGLPFVGVGAGAHAAWGGTNMRAASSDLVDVSSLPDTDIQTHSTRIRVRGLGTRIRRIRRTRYGPILNDARLLRVRGGDVALRWMGAEASDEIGAFLQAARARTAEEFRAAFTDFGVCAQNILFATRSGDIGHLYAAHLPQRPPWPEHTPVLSPAQADAAWAQTWNSMRLPLTINPAEGYRVSANDQPQFRDAPLGYFFSEGDRAARLATLASCGQIDVAALRAMHIDTCVPGAAVLAQALCTELENAGIKDSRLDALRHWNGDYAADAPQPVMFESLLHALATGLRGGRSLLAVRELDDEWGRHTRLLLQDLDALDSAARKALLRRAAAAATRAAAQYPSWGDMHRLRIDHLLGMVPMLGRALRVADWPAGGSRESPMKNAHGLVHRRHAVQYGAQARHTSDLADLDTNHFVLLGGNDGWVGSANYADQLALWRQGGYVQMPLRPETVAAQFPMLCELLPAANAVPAVQNADTLISASPAG